MELPTNTNSGVYGLYNENNGKCYIGSAKNFRMRAQSHVNELRKGTHCNKYLQHSWDKHGEAAFTFLIVELCEPEDCVAREQWWIDDLNVTDRSIGYNMAPKAGTSPVFGIGHTEESRRKMSEQRKGIVPVAATAAAAIANKGKKKSEAFCKNLSEKLTGRKHSVEHTAKLSGENHWCNRPGGAEIVAATAEKNRGKQHTEEHKQKIGEGHWSNREDAEEIRAKVAASVSASKKGKKMSAEAKKNMALGQQRRQAAKRQAREAAYQEYLAAIEAKREAKINAQQQ